jgi:hypothetical protein
VAGEIDAALWLDSSSRSVGRASHEVQPRLWLKLLGSMAAQDIVSGESVLPRVRKTRAVLGVLALSAPRLVLRDYLAGLLWSRREREQARASLRQAVHELQVLLHPLGEGLLRPERNHLRLNPAVVWTDVHALARATPQRPEALDLFDGPLMDDLNGLDAAFDCGSAWNKDPV